MVRKWDDEGSRASVRARNPDKFIRQQIAPLLFHATTRAQGGTEEFATEKDFWRCSEEIALASVRLEKFRVSDWFPRTPGVYWSSRGVNTREYAWSGPTIEDPELGSIFEPETKMSLIEDGGIGTIRLRPRRIDGTDCWFATAVQGRQCAGGVPLALPHSLVAEGKIAWGDTASIRGTVRFLQDAGLEDIAAYVHHASPIIIFVEEIENVRSLARSESPIVLTPVALFDHQSERTGFRRGSDADFGYTFVQSLAGPHGDVHEAADWMESYAAKYNGRVITNFDERSPTLADAPLSYQRLISASCDRQVVKHFHLEGVVEQLSVTNEYNNFGQVGAMGDRARSSDNTFLGSSDVDEPERRKEKSSSKSSRLQKPSRRRKEQR